LYRRLPGPLARVVSIATVLMAGLFSLIALVFGLIALWSAQAGEWVIAAAAAVLAAWMATFAWSAIRRARV
jgi:membrane protein YdbS with pleckstrin-like domain